MIWEKLKALFNKEEPVFEEGWLEILEESVPLYGRLPEDLQARLRERAARFIASTRFEGCNRLVLTEEMVISVAAQACLLVLFRDGEPYPNLKVVYLYPSTFHSVEARRDSLGIVTEERVHRLGESWDNGTVILAWDSVEQGAKNIYDARNVTFHEFAHQLDHEDGPTDGAPALASRVAYRSWAHVFRENYERFQDDLKSGRKTLIDAYGGTEPAEFFAVVTETFFEKPRQLAKKYPGLYEELRNYYRVDPREWF